MKYDMCTDYYNTWNLITFISAIKFKTEYFLEDNSIIAMKTTLFWMKCRQIYFEDELLIRQDWIVVLRHWVTMLVNMKYDVTELKQHSLSQVKDI